MQILFLPLKTPDRHESAEDTDLLETSVHDLQFFAAEPSDSAQLVDAFRFTPHHWRLPVIQTVTCNIHPFHTFIASRIYRNKKLSFPRLVSSASTLPTNDQQAFYPV